MAWQPISQAPRNGTTIMLARVGLGQIEFNGRWGVHRQTGVERWVDGNGMGLFEPTHFDYQPEPPQPHKNNDYDADGA